MLPRARTAAAVAALFLAGAPVAEARALPAGYVVTHVVGTVTRYHWSARADGTYRVAASREPHSFTVVFATAQGSPSARSRASASRR
jgi:ABC-type sugar transport system substrate-binding protein